MSRRGWVYVALALSGLVVLVIDMRLGSTAMDIGTWWQALATGPSTADSAGLIVWQLRVPRALSAFAAGTVLALSGLLLQVVFRNPIAAPGILGVTGGAALAVYLFIFAGVVSADFFLGGVAEGWGPWLLVGAGMAGALAVIGLLLFTSLAVRSSTVLLLVGLMISQLAIGIVSLLQYFSDPSMLQQFLLWNLGSLSSVSLAGSLVLLAFAVVFVLMGLPLRGTMDAYQLGDRQSFLLGKNPLRFRRLTIVLVAAAVGASTALVGPVAFVGLIVPHAVRGLLRTGLGSQLFVPVALAGGLFLVGVDVIATLPGMAYKVPVNALTSIIGAPLVVLILLPRRSASSW